MSNPWVVQVSEGGFLFAIYGPFPGSREAQAFARAQASPDDDIDADAYQLFRPAQAAEDHT